MKRGKVSEGREGKGMKKKPKICYIHISPSHNECYHMYWKHELIKIKIFKVDPTKSV